MKETTRKNVSTGIYVRVSTDEQVQEGFSIRAQVEKLKSYALLKDWDIFDIYADEGISGKNIVDRPAINRLIDDIESGQVNNVLVFKVDRLTRNTRNLLELVELFDECNCAFNSLTESIDTDTASGRMFLKIIGIFAEFERENLVSRLKLGFERKAKEGYSLASFVSSYGYTRENGEKIQTIEPDEAKIVKEIFSMFVDKNITINKIARILNQRKIPTKKTGSWQASTVKRTLTNPNYIGKIRYSIADESRYFEADGQHERIISDEIYYLAQEKINSTPQTVRTKRPKVQSYFCGYIYCEQCNNKFGTHNYLTKTKGEEKSYRTSYVCNGKVNLNEDIACTSSAIGHTKLEQAFIEYIENINDITENQDIDIEDKAQKAEQELLASIVDCEKKLNNLQERKKQVMEQYVQGLIEFDEYKNMISMFNENFEAIENDLQHKKAELPTIVNTPEILPEDIVTNLKQNWDKLSDNERMIFLQRFVKKITLKVDKEKGKTTTVKIKQIEFNLHNEAIHTKGESVRGKLRKGKSIFARTGERSNNTTRNTPVLV